MEPHVPSVRVPEGHQVRFHKLAAQPSVSVAPSGAILAHFGVASDDDSEVDAVFSAARAAAGRPIRLIPPGRPLTAAFEPDAKALGVPKLIVWTAVRGGLARFFAAHSPEVVAAKFRAIQAMHVLYVHDAWVPRAVVRALMAAGVGVRLPEAEDRVFLEVYRPDQSILVGVLGNNATGSDTPARGHVERAPRLAAKIAAALASPSYEASLLADLRERSHPLLFLVMMPSENMRVVDFGDGRPTLLVYSSDTDVAAAAAELGLKPRTWAIGSLDARALLAHAKQAQLRIALALFRPDGTVVSYLLDGKQLDGFTR